MTSHKVIIISGPTATGKSDIALDIAKRIGNAEIINVDIGSFYSVATVGTAKPDYEKEPIEHHFFDVLDTPVHWTVSDFRKQLAQLLDEIFSRGNVPILVGGSAFYVQAFFYQSADIPAPSLELMQRLEAQLPQELYAQLQTIDPVRAQQIYPQDHYRLVRALAIYHTTGKKPSEFAQTFAPLAPFEFITFVRDRQHIYEKINARTPKMFDMGWLEEVQGLQNTVWESFLSKKLLGYEEMFLYAAGQITKEQASGIIAQKTRNYAKRQLLFLKKLQTSIKADMQANELYQTWDSSVLQINLTLCDLGLYINQIIDKAKTVK